MKLRYLATVVLMFSLGSLVAHAKSTFTPPPAALSADKRAVFWPRRMPGDAALKEVYTIDLVISDATGDRGGRQITVTSDGRVFVDSVDTKVQVGAAFVSAVRVFGAVVDKVIDAVAKAGRLTP